MQSGLDRILREAKNMKTAVLGLIAGCPLCSLSQQAPRAFDFVATKGVSGRGTERVSQRSVAREQRRAMHAGQLPAMQYKKQPRSESVREGSFTSMLFAKRNQWQW